jgi:hypothetical protein
MKHARSFGFDALESRMLLSSGHDTAAHHAARADAATGAALVLSGTLTVDNRAAIMQTDAESDSINQTPVSGDLGALGEVHGVWTETFDTYGDYIGPDTIALHSSKGTIVVDFNDQNILQSRAVKKGPATYEYAQRVQGGTDAFVHTSETGTLVLTTNAPRTSIATMQFETGKP